MTQEKKFLGGCLLCEFETENREEYELHNCTNQILCNACGQFVAVDDLDASGFHKPIKCDAFELRSVFIEGRLWFDKINGNTYFSNRVWVNGKVTFEMPMEYGYDLQHVNRAIQELFERGYLPKVETFRTPYLWQIREEMGVDIYFSSTYGKKSELFKGARG